MDKVVKVAYLVRPAEGGMKTHLLTLLAGLDRTKYEPVVICPPGTPLAHDVAAIGVPVFPLDIVGPLNPLKDVLASLNLRKILKEIKPDILHMHGAKAGLVGRQALFFSRRRPKTILTFHNFVVDEHTGTHVRKLVAQSESLFSRVTDSVIAVSQALKDELVSTMGIDASLVQVIYNGIKFFDVPPTPHDDVRIGVISRLVPQKGVEYFIRAASLVMTKFPQATFFIIGDGPQCAALSDLVHALALGEGVYFLGKKSDIPEQLSTLDMLIFPSLQETFGITLVEALNQRLPVIASNVGGIPEIIQDGQTGLLVQPGDPTAIANAIIRLLEDRDYARQLGEAGCADVRARFYALRMIQQTETLYADVLSRKRRKVRA